jgi:EAL domain-containing protein (putative c-di-GMP-specific phosphodiesterase class I)
VALARTINLQVVAEGVGTQEQLEFLTRLDCNTLQGYLPGKPVSADTIAASHLKQDNQKLCCV